MATSYQPALNTATASAPGAANLQSVVLLLLAQLQNAHNSTMARLQAELQEEREKYIQKMNRLQDKERDMSFEIDRQRSELENLLELKEKYRQKLETLKHDLEVKENIINHLENEKSNFTNQNPMQMELCVEVKHSLSASVPQNQQQQKLLGKRREETKLISPVKMVTGYFKNDSLNQYVWNIPETCEEELYILDSYLKMIPALLPAKVVDVALLEATKLNHIEEMEALLATGVSINKLTADSRTLLWWAAHNGNVAACQVLLSHGARMNAISPGWIGSTALHAAAWAGHLKVVQLLVENGSDIETKSWESQTVIFYAARRGQVNIVKYLVEQGADLEARDVNGKTAIEMATAPVAKWFKTWLAERNDSG